MVITTTLFKGWYTYNANENCLIFKTPHPLSIYVWKFSTHLTLDVQFYTNPPTLSSKLYRTVQVNESNQNKNKTKSRHIQIDHTFYCSI